MPIAVDPAQTVDFSLALDRAKPEESRPTFVCRYLTCRQVLAVEQLIKAAADPATPQAKENDLLNQAFAIFLANWTNLAGRDGAAVAFNCAPATPPAPATIDALDDVLTPAEKWELLYGALAAIRVSEQDKKKSALRPAGATAPSAAPAAAENASTPPASESRSG